MEELIHNCDLNDFKPIKGNFTWSNNRVGSANIAARLDRFLVQSTLMDEKHIISSNIFSKLSLDHHPISLIFEKEDDLGPIPFRFSPLWIDYDSFWDTVHLAWSQYVVGSPNFVWEQKLKNTKFALKN